MPHIWTKIHIAHYSFILWYTSVVPSRLCLDLPRNLSPSGSRIQICMHLSSVMYTTRSCHLNLLPLIILIISDQVYKSWSSSPSDPYILTNIHFSNTKNLGLYSFLNVWNQVTYYIQQNVRNRWREPRTCSHYAFSQNTWRQRTLNQTADNILYT